MQGGVNACCVECEGIDAVVLRYGNYYVKLKISMIPRVFAKFTYWCLNNQTDYLILTFVMPLLGDEVEWSVYDT